MGKHNYSVVIGGIAKPGMETHVKRCLKELMQHSRIADGCILYNIHQSVGNPAEFMIYMLWKDKESFEHHNHSTGLQEFKNNLAKEWVENQSPKTWYLLD